MSDVPPDFDGFVRDQLPRLLRFATVLTGDPELAADVVQDALVKAHGHWRRIAAADRPDLYVRRMVVNQHLSWRRRWHVRTVVPVADDVLLARVAAEPDVSARVSDRDDVRHRLEQLPPRQRAVLVLRFFEDLDDAEIARVLGTSPVTVRSHASRALAALRRHALHVQEVL